MNREYRKRLMYELKKICDDKDFVCGVSSILGKEALRKKMLEYIDAACKNGDEITSENIIRLAMIFREEDQKSVQSGIKRKVAAAVL